MVDATNSPTKRSLTMEAARAVRDAALAAAAGKGIDHLIVGQFEFPAIISPSGLCGELKPIPAILKIAFPFLILADDRGRADRRSMAQSRIAVPTS